MANCAKSAPLLSLSMIIFDLRTASPSLVASSFLRLRICGSFARSDDDLRDAVLRLRDVELVQIGVVEIDDVLIGDGNFRGDFAIQQLLNGKLTAQVALEVVNRHACATSTGAGILLR